MKQEESQQHKNPEYHQYQEDEVELIDYLRVIWKWKWLIIVGTFLCVLAAGVYGFTRPVVRMYKVSALIEIDPKAKLDPLDKIKAMIEYGIYNGKILKDLQSFQEITKPQSLNFEVNIPKGLNILDIVYKTPNLDLGKAVLNTLINQLEQEYKERIEQVRYQFDETIKKKSKSIKGIKANIQIIEKKFKNEKILKENEIRACREDIKRLRENIRVVKNSIDETKNALKQAQSNSDKLAAQRKAIILDSQNKTGHKDVFMQAAVIQKIINYPIVLINQICLSSFKEKQFSKLILHENNKIGDLEAQVELIELEVDQCISVEKDKIAVLKSVIETLKHDRDKITGMIVKQSPTASLLPIKYKTKLNTILAGVVGLFMFLFLAFFIEYIKKASKHNEEVV